MIVRKRTQVFITVEMTKEQSTSLKSALKKVNEFAITSDRGETLFKEEAEVLHDLRHSLLDS